MTGSLIHRRPWEGGDFSLYHICPQFEHLYCFPILPLARPTVATDMALLDVDILFALFEPQ